MTVSAVKIIQPGEIQNLPADDTPLLVLAKPSEVFQERYSRFEQLAKSSDLKEWLSFCAQLAQVQTAMQSEIKTEAPSESVILESFKHGMPPLSMTTWKALDDWQIAKDLFVKHMSSLSSLHPGVKKALEAFTAAQASELKKQAEAFLKLEEEQVRADWAPFIGAILQVLWVRKAADLLTHIKDYRGESTLCPVCGSHPVASVVRVGNRDGHRYLCCSLCSAEWYASRAKCTNCETPKEVTMLGETKESLVQGECCDDCSGYLKIMYQSKDPVMDVVADDLATLGLDLALAKEGYQRTGRNMFFMASGENQQKDA